MLGVWDQHRVEARTFVHISCVKLQALVYDILLWKKVPESEARSVQLRPPRRVCEQLVPARLEEGCGNLVLVD